MVTWQLGTTSISFAQTITVTGLVTEESGEPVIGAAIILQKSTDGTVTDVDGRFSLNVPRNGVLEFRYIGLETEIVPVNGRTTINVVLKSNSVAMDEVVVVAYGTTKRTSFTGSASTTSAADLELRPLGNAAQALDGTAPGVQVSTTTGQPGESPTIRIRGFGTINGSADPLYVVDGAIYNGNIADINPLDIESITILKDAASTSLYGSSAGNGVVMVTTKKGRSDRVQISFNMTQGTSNRSIKEYDRVSVWDYYPLQWEQLKNSYITNGNTPEEAANRASANIHGTQLRYNPFKGVPNDQIVLPNGTLNPLATTLLYSDDLDWIDGVSRTAYRGEYNLSYNNKTDKSDSYASIGYLNDQGYVEKSDFTRFSGRANVNVYPKKWIKTGFNVSATRVSQKRASTGNTTYVNPFFFARTIGPIYPIHEHNMTTGEYILDSNGDKVFDYLGSRGGGAHTGRHVVAETLWNDPNRSRDAINGRTYLDLNVYKGLKLSTSVSLDNSNQKSKSYDNSRVGDGAPAGRISLTDIRISTYTFNQLLTYNTSIGKNTFDALLGHENYSYTYEYYTGGRTGIIAEGIYEFANFLSSSSQNSYTHTYTKEGYFGRLNYDYDNKYYASFSYRHDGSSKFSPDNRWGNFLSAGVSWRMDQEVFLKQVKWVNSLKLRASFGQTGNDNGGDDFGYYPYQTLYNLNNNNGDESGVLFSKYGNANLKWETQISTDLAVEFALFNWLSGTVEYFRKDSKDLLFNVAIPYSSGGRDVWQNIGKVSNSGIEMAFDFRILRNKNWNIKTGINATFLHNEIKGMPKDTDGKPIEIIDDTRKLAEGHSIYEFWLKDYQGVDPATGNAMYIFDEELAWDDKTCYTIDGKRVTTDSSKGAYHYAKSSIPTVYGGYNASVKYRNFDVALILAYSLGGKFYDGSYKYLMEVNAYGRAMSTDIYNRWQKPGDVTNVPRLDSNMATDYNTPSDRWLSNASYLNIKSLSISYQLPRSLVKSIDLDNVRLSVSGENLYLFTARQGMDPQMAFNGNGTNVYVPNRVLTCGLNLTF
ncbi:SusC/RagA family TonB-linked outer membrane protein [Bacteroidia bacterium]|nr:SusC/RagA family TonB-linked outer membrane protein [Bacteroidia bacterium]